MKVFCPASQHTPAPHRDGKHYWGPTWKDLSGQWSPTFLAPGTGLMEDSVSMDQGNKGEGGEFGADSSTLHVLCTIFISIYYFSIMYLLFFTSIIIALAPPQVIRHWILDAEGPCFRTHCGASGSGLGAASLAGTGSPCVASSSDFLSLLFLLLWTSSYSLLSLCCMDSAVSCLLFHDCWLDLEWIKNAALAIWLHGLPFHILILWS